MASPAREFFRLCRPELNGYGILKPSRLSADADLIVVVMIALSVIEALQRDLGACPNLRSVFLSDRSRCFSGGEGRLGIVGCLTGNRRIGTGLDQKTVREKFTGGFYNRPR